jgi:sterol desaturase/sphingolipid hydroxylase (fatty acid hydroxylase superfamily)
MALGHERAIFGLVTAASVVVGPSLLMLVERLRPVTDPPMGGVLFNFSCAVLLHKILGGFLSVAVSALAVVAVNRCGGGLFVLPAAGLGLVGGIFVYTVLMDLGEYLFHRAQHCFPILWAMHSFHHSDAAMNVSTTQRHFWLEQAIKSVTIYPLVGLLLKANPPVFFAYSLIAFANYFFHMNLRVGFGRYSFLLNSPQYHRIHHSRQPEHLDTNFAALLPIFDLLLGSYYVGGPDEYPATGLIQLDEPAGMFEAFVWPLRGGHRAPSPNAAEA